jgi:hypothetical protein
MITAKLSIAHRYFDAWNQHDYAVIVAVFNEGGTYVDPMTRKCTYRRSDWRLRKVPVGWFPGSFL